MNPAGIRRLWRLGLPTQSRRLLVLLLILAGGAVIVATVGAAPVEEIRGWAQHASWAAPLLFAALYAALSLTRRRSSCSVSAPGCCRVARRGRVGHAGVRWPERRSGSGSREACAGPRSSSSAGSDWPGWTGCCAAAACSRSSRYYARGLTAVGTGDYLLGTGHRAPAAANITQQIAQLTTCEQDDVDGQACAAAARRAPNPAWSDTLRIAFTAKVPLSHPSVDHTPVSIATSR